VKAIGKRQVGEGSVGRQSSADALIVSVTVTMGVKCGVALRLTACISGSLNQPSDMPLLRRDIEQRPPSTLEFVSSDPAVLSAARIVCSLGRPRFRDDV
jgi:hypothetical protein